MSNNIFHKNLEEANNLELASLKATISSCHYQEWLNSGIDPQLIALNLISLKGHTPFEYLLYDDPGREGNSKTIPRRNDGRLTDGFLKRYRHLEDGGWYCGTIDPLTGTESLWGCFKPNRPRVITEENRGFGDSTPCTKTIKYEHPPKKNTEAFLLKVPDTLWQKIAEGTGIYPSCRLPLPENEALPGAELRFRQGEPSLPILGVDYR
ncbi:hypothetical protein V0288_22760 [Pannus brasiliensis CCIBt3594]|uniref:Uncharacterized protein n=1 Tax=Pannus brasiliensis CCIBt3594 TaxID=1427578 RepID=A0AAW9QQB2_9CHRO